VDLQSTQTLTWEKKQGVSIHNNKQDKVTKTMEEKRKHRRYPCFESTFFLTKKGLYEGVIKNKDKEAVKGVFIATEEDITVGEVITVAIPSSGEKKGRKLRGVIVRKQPGGFGVQFKNNLND